MHSKILYIVNVDWFFISHRLPIAIEAKNNGYDVHVACAVTDNSDYLTKLGFTVHDLPLSRSGVGFFSEVKSIYSIYGLIRKLSPEVLHMITIKPVLYGGLISRFFSVKKRIASISGLGYVFISETVKARFLRYIVVALYRIGLSKINTFVIFQNSSDKALFLKEKIISKEQTFLIRGSGVNLLEYKYHPEPKGKPVVMFLARLLKDKGLIEFLEAAKFLKSQNIDARFVLVGDIDLHNPNSITKEELSLYIKDGTVEAWGYSKHVQEIIPKSNIMVLPSYREGLPKSLIEAAACGRAVITTDVPGCRDAIEKDVTGLLVEPKNVKSLADAIFLLLNNDELREQFGLAGRKLAEQHFDIKDVVNKHMDIYRGKK